jgi:hypothetical protein
MRRITLVTAICVAATTMLIAGWKFGAPAPKAAIATADAAGAANLIAPFEQESAGGSLGRVLNSPLRGPLAPLHS